MTAAADGSVVLPDRISVPRLNIDAPVVAATVDDAGALSVPADPTTLGWWAGGPLPGSVHGSAVLDGHVDSAVTGPGALFRLRQLNPGDRVTITGYGGEVTYQITGLREYDKATLPSTQLFQRTGAARLVLITCGGPFNSNTHHYRDNIVAFGTEVQTVPRDTSRLPQSSP